MRILSLIIVLFISFSTLSAQHKTLRIDIEEIYAQYQNGYNNATHAYNKLVDGYRKASQMDVHYYFQLAQKYTKSSKTYVEKAINTTEQLAQNYERLECEEGKTDISEAKLIFEATSAKLDGALEAMATALTVTDVHGFGDHMQTSVQSLQSVVQLLNEAMDHINAATALLSSCR